MNYVKGFIRGCSVLKKKKERRKMQPGRRTTEGIRR
jgi:hypothetical protein